MVKNQCVFHVEIRLKEGFVPSFPIARRHSPISTLKATRNRYHISHLMVGIATSYNDTSYSKIVIEQGILKEAKNSLVKYIIIVALSEWYFSGLWTINLLVIKQI